MYTIYICMRVTYVNMQLTVVLGTHKQQADCCKAFPAAIGIHLKCSKQSNGDEEGWYSIQEVPDKVGQPVACGVKTTHKLEMLSLEN